MRRGQGAELAEQVLIGSRLVRVGGEQDQFLARILLECNCGAAAEEIG